MKKRTRLMQRNVRTVLILVDGKSTVADLCLKTANPQLTEYALGELVKGGFIEPRAGQEAGFAKGTNGVQAVNATDNLESSESAATLEESVAEPTADEIPVPEESATQVLEEENLSVSTSADDQIGSVEALAEERVPAIDVAADAIELSEISSDGSDEVEPEELKPDLVERIKALMGDEKNTNEIEIPAEPIQYRKAEPRNWKRMAVVGLASALALSLLALILFPYSRFLPEVEQAFSQTIGRPVKVGSMRVDVFPSAGLLLGDVRIGTGDNEIRAAELHLQPVLSTLLSSKIYFRHAVLTGAVLPLDRIVTLPAVFDAMTKPTASLGVERISLERSDISFWGLGFSGMEGEVRLAAGGALQSLSMRSPDHTMSLDVKPISQTVGIVLEGFAWRPFQGSPYLFDSVNLSGTYKGGDFTIDSMELHIFDGVVKGSGVLAARPKPSIVGEVSFERINASRFGNALGIGDQFTGDTSGNLAYTAASDSWTSLFSVLEANGDFTMRRGSIRGVDLAEAVRRISKSSVQGGLTLFENLSGKVKLTPKRYQFSGLVLNSGLMQSTGYFDVSKNLEVNGKVVLQMQGTVNQTRAPISISGPLGAPVVKVGKE